MTKIIKKAVFPVGGLGTRFLPATKAMPKEMLTVVDKPLIQYAVEEARAAVVVALERKPDRSLAYLEKTLPTKHPGGLAPYLDGLRKAGLPE